MVGVGGEGGPDELLEETSERLALGSKAPLLLDDVALLVELAEDRVHEPLGLEIGP